MIVYRVCREDEYNQIFGNSDFSNIGNYFDDQETKKINTHKYKENTRYLHFFLNLKEGVQYLLINEGTYICKYDIPDEILKQCEGFGYYVDMNNYYRQEMIEYAIESKRIKFDYLKQVIYISEYIEPSRIYDGVDIMNFGEVLYDLTGETDNNKIYSLMYRFKK